ncbi:hypothetical protein Tco_0520612 [Tanacetum coccineum]
MEAQWALAERRLHGLQAPETSNIFNEKSSYGELSETAKQAKRLREVLTLNGHVESVVKLQGLDIDTIQHHYTVCLARSCTIEKGRAYHLSFRLK